jgi:hypothetical protein
MITCQGNLLHGGGGLQGSEQIVPWAGSAEISEAAQPVFAPGEKIGLLVDLRPHRRSLAVYHRGRRLGLVVPEGLPIPLRW